MDKELQQAGFDVAKLTEQQKYLIMQPSYAPENYHMDGEISPKQAFQYWKQRLVKAGLSPADVKRAVELHFGK